MTGHFIRVLACAGGIGLLATGAGAATYNEAVDGDLSNDQLNPTAIGTLSLGSNTISASLTGTPQDDADNFSFVVAAGSELSQIVWTYDLTGFSNSGNFYLYDSDDNLIEAFNNLFGASGSNFLGAPVGPGSYRFDIRGYGDRIGLASYTLDLRTVSTDALPLPGAAWLMFGGLAALTLVSRRGRARDRAG